MKIKSITSETVENTKVYNLHCTPNENYFANGLLVHNCYKSNTYSRSENMSLETFKVVLGKLNQSGLLTQVACGIGDIDANPEIWEIFAYCRAQDIVPNVTINGARLSDEAIGHLTTLCGAVAVSVYDPKEVCYDAVRRLTEDPMKQKITVRKKL